VSLPDKRLIQPPVQEIPRKQGIEGLQLPIDISVITFLIICTRFTNKKKADPPSQQKPPIAVADINHEVVHYTLFYLVNKEGIMSVVYRQRFIQYNLWKT